MLARTSALTGVGPAAAIPLYSRYNTIELETNLLAIARYKALSARRRRTDAELDDNIASTVADPADGPDLVLEEKGTTELMRECLARLSPDHRDVIDLVPCCRQLTKIPIKPLSVARTGVSANHNVGMLPHRNET
jgi:hypothetical protein